MDTISTSPLKIRGAQRVSDVLYLKPNPSPLPVIFTPLSDDQEAEVPAVYLLRQNYHNPFNPTTTIEFELPQPSIVTLKIYNIMGQEVATVLDHEEMDDGTQEVEFDAQSLASGVYLYRIMAEGITDEEVDDSTRREGTVSRTFVSVKKMLLIK